MKKGYRTRGRIVRIISFFVWIIYCLLIELIIMLPITNRELARLGIELSQMVPPENAVLIERKNLWKTSQAAVIEKYYIDWDVEEVNTYYERLLKENSWKYMSGPITSLPYVEWTYCKQDYTFRYSINEGGINTWKYEIGIFWGLSSSCFMEKGIPINILFIGIGLLVVVIISCLLDWKKRVILQ